MTRVDWKEKQSKKRNYVAYTFQQITTSLESIVCFYPLYCETNNNTRKGKYYFEVELKNGNKIKFEEEFDLKFEIKKVPGLFKPREIKVYDNNPGSYFEGKLYENFEKERLRFKHSWLKFLSKR